ncbi:putative Ca2+ ATPase [Suhomyces tanzawaensis NRRL Y-17324]|uniref:Putative Ca2+ ATPase n=1 Tax=Suhomyces tanzawaensis NRRL Y-17324 TaxID=984487 RepID=A0A1E4SRT1_9ASCO|nr:putative Ca2+ ATPase [Suhomyces tanzawaensis NRRL Y-17324]ODV82223.1 putative Ca2+ ATPase [Suhomyces tanzawaensis NRRL Y-17324]
MEPTPTYSDASTTKFDDDNSAIITTEEKIRFEDDLETGRSTTRRKRRFSIHSRESKNTIFTINEKAQPEAVLPGIFKTISHKVDNDLEKEVNLDINSTPNKFSKVDFHTTSASTIAQRFGSSTSYGLSDSQKEKSFKEYGPNLQSKPPSGMAKKIFMHFFGGFGGLLVTGGVLCCVCWKPLGSPPAISNLILGIILFVVFFAQALFNFFQDFSSSRVMDSIHNMIPTECSVIRNGQTLKIDSKDLVPGDLVLFTAGDKIPADIRVTDASPDLSFDRSILTGESNPIPASSNSDPEKTNYLESNSIAMQGTFGVNGSGRGIVVATGDNTIFGSIAKLTSKPKKGLTPLQYEIVRFVALTSTIIIALVVLVVILWAAWLRKSYPDWINVPSLIVDIVSIAVAFIPEGLPIALTTCLIITANQMRKNKILCKSLSVVETLGSISVLCFDKTGTLTKNAMVVTNVCDGLQELDIDEVDPHRPIDNHLITIASLCTEANIVAEVATNGNATDRAILQFAHNSSGSVDAYKNRWNKTFEVAFNSKEKYMATLLEPSSQEADIWNDIGFNANCIEFENEYLLTVKGAPDILLENCGFVMEKNNTLTVLSQESKQHIEKIQHNWSRNGKRVVMMASKLIPKDSLNLSDRLETVKLIREAVKSDLILVGLVGIEDPPRKDIDKVINQLREAGIKIIMITGDFELTGLSIAKQCGIVTTDKVDSVDDLSYELIENVDDNSRAISITGPQLKRVSEEQWQNLIQYNELVFTRTTPEQKLLIIKQFQKYKQIIGMTGDGINDAPSLKQADVGISIITASDIAKEAADLILMDGDNEDHLFFSIIQALKYGRLVFENLKKTIGYLLPAGTYAELWPVLLNVIFGMPQMLSSFCMIIICCVTDCLGAMMLAYEEDERNLLKKKPRSVTKERLVDFKLFLHSYFTIGTFYTFTSMMLAFINMQRSGVSFSKLTLSYGSYSTIPGVSDAINVSSSIYFNNLVIMQLFNLLSMRTRYLSVFQHSPLRNYRLFVIMPIAFGVTFIINYIPAIQTTLGSGKVPVEYYFISLGFGLVVLIYDELRKLANRRYPSGPLAKIAW